MSTEIAQHGVLFDEKYSWNFALNAVSEGIVKKPEANYVFEEIVESGKKARWITPYYQRAAREMFVFSEAIFFPVNRNIPGTDPLYDNGYIKWPEPLHALAEEEMIYALIDPGVSKNLKPFILKSLNSRGHSLDARQFDEIIDLWDRERINPSAEKLKHEIMSEAHSLLTSLFLSEHSIPTYSDIPSFTNQRYSDVIFSLPAQHQNQLKPNTLRNEVEMVAFYFDKANIYCPSPSTMREALKIRELENIDKWRVKMCEWITKLSTQEIDSKKIENDIKEANEYIQGAEITKKVIDRFSLVIGIGATVGSVIAPQFSPLGTAITLGIGAIQLYGEAIVAGVRDPATSKYPWFMISTSK